MYSWHSRGNSVRVFLHLYVRKWENISSNEVRKVTVYELDDGVRFLATTALWPLQCIPRCRIFWPLAAKWPSPRLQLWCSDAVALLHYPEYRLCTFVTVGLSSWGHQGSLTWGTVTCNAAACMSGIRSTLHCREYVTKRLAPEMKGSPVLAWIWKIIKHAKSASINHPSPTFIFVYPCRNSPVHFDICCSFHSCAGWHLFLSVEYHTGLSHGTPFQTLFF
jgi:hypothetical protein